MAKEKTAMQELIEYMSGKQDTANLPAYAAYELAIRKATELLSKEREQIVNAREDGYTVETECCNNPTDGGACCGIPRPVQVQCEVCHATGKINTPPVDVKKIAADAWTACRNYGALPRLYPNKEQYLKSLNNQ